MHHPNILVKVAAITGSLLLGTGFVMYQTHDLDRLLASADILPSNNSSVYQGGLFMPRGTDTTEIHRRLLLLDSTQRAFLGLLSGQFPPPEGVSYFDRSYLDSILRKAMNRSRGVMMGSSKSASPIRAGIVGFRMIDSIRMVLLSDTAIPDSMTKQMSDPTRFATISVSLEEIIYPEASGSADRMKRIADSFPMSSLGIWGMPAVDTLHTTGEGFEGGGKDSGMKKDNR